MLPQGNLAGPPRRSSLASLVRRAVRLVGYGFYVVLGMLPRRGTIATSPASALRKWKFTKQDAAVVAEISDPKNPRGKYARGRRNLQQHSAASPLGVGQH